MPKPLPLGAYHGRSSTRRICEHHLLAGTALLLETLGSSRFPILMVRLALPSLLAMAAAPTIGAVLIDADGAPLTFATLLLLSALNVVLAAILVMWFRR